MGNQLNGVTVIDRGDPHDQFINTRAFGKANKNSRLSAIGLNFITATGLPFIKFKIILVFFFQICQNWTF